MGRIIGIDLGTTNSVVAVVEGNEPRVVANEEGARVTPSTVAWTASGEVLVGEMARRQGITNTDGTVYSIKRFMGQRFDAVAADRLRVTYSVEEGANGDAAVRVGGRLLSPPEVSAKVLGKLKRAAELYLGEAVEEAVITVPAYFNDAQRKATRDAGEIAGLKVKRIINEPTAAALAYGMDRKRNQTLAVYDFGGGTFDISILEVADNVVEVLSTSGDTHLGGDDIDARIVQQLQSQFLTETGIAVGGDRMVMQRLRDAAERAKVELSSTVETEINLPFLTADASGPKHLHFKLSRARLEQLSEELVERTMSCCEKALADAKLEVKDLDEVVLVGGSTRMPLVQQRVQAFFQREPHRGVNPDEVVALGAAVQGAVMSGDIDSVLLLDVTPLTLGVETSGGIMAKVIERNTTVPTRRTKIFSTAADNQSVVEIHVCQGERGFAKENRSLGRFELSGIPPAPRAQPQIEVVFDIDANGILKVSAEEKGSGKCAEISISGAGGLAEDEIRRAVQEAEAARDEDSRRRKLAESRNRLQGLIFGVNKQLGSLSGPDYLLRDASVALGEGERVLADPTADEALYAGAVASMIDVACRVRQEIELQRSGASGVEGDAAAAPESEVGESSGSADAASEE